MASGLENIETIESPFRRFVTTIGVFPTAFTDAMTYYECLAYLVKYLEETVIPAVNENAEALEELQVLYIQLKSYVDNYFDNLDVQQEINNKLDQMAEDGSLYTLITRFTSPIIEEFENDVQNQINTQNLTISAFDAKVNSLASGSPLVASSTSEMVDTTRVYVNTTDGYWYYYDGDSWEQGGIYQSTGINDNSITPEKTVFYKQVQLVPESDWVEGKNWQNGSLVDYAPASSSTKKVPVTAGEKIISSNYTASNVKYEFFTDGDVYVSDIICYNNQFTIITVPSTAAYYCISLLNLLTTVKPTNLNMYRYSDYFGNINDKKAVIKEDYFNNITTDDILIDAGIKCVDKYLNLTAFTNVEHSINDNIISLSGNNDHTGTTYTAICFKPLAGVQVGDVIKVKSNCGIRCDVFPWDITQTSPVTGTVFTRLDFRNTTEAELTITQDMVDYLTASENNALSAGIGIPSTVTDFSYYFKFYNAKGTTLTDVIMNDYVKPATKVLVLGDSITKLAGDRSWLTYFNQITPISIIQNVAVDGAWLNDKEGTVYDGNPVSGGPDHDVNNVLGNQVQKILNNNYEAPDAIFIAIGTNSGITCTEEEIYHAYYNQFDQLIPLENVDRKTSAGAFRYCSETLRNKYPNATIFWFSPIQGANGLRKLTDIITWGKNLNNLCKYGSDQFINSEDCGITGYTEHYGVDSKYLIDGLHPNANGAKVLGLYNGTKVQEYYQKLHLTA